MADENSKSSDKPMKLKFNNRGGHRTTSSYNDHSGSGSNNNGHRSGPHSSYGRRSEGGDVVVKFREKRQYHKPTPEEIRQKELDEKKAKEEAIKKASELKAKAAEKKRLAEEARKKYESNPTKIAPEELKKRKEAEKASEEFRKSLEEEALRKAEEASKKRVKEAQKLSEENAKRWAAEEAARKVANANVDDDNSTSRYVKEAEEQQEREEENLGRRRTGVASKKSVHTHEEEEHGGRGNTHLSRKQLRGAARANQKAHGFNKPVAPVARDVVIGETVTVAELADKMAVKAAEVIRVIMKLGDMVTINQVIDQETAQVVAEEMGHKVILRKENELEQEVLSDRDTTAKAEPRAPVVTIM